MATSRNVMMSILLMILACMQVCSGESDTMLQPENMDASKIISALQGVAQAMECCSGIMQGLPNMVVERLAEMQAKNEENNQKVVDQLVEMQQKNEENNQQVRNLEARLAQLLHQVEVHFENEKKPIIMVVERLAEMQAKNEENNEKVVDRLAEMQEKREEDNQQVRKLEGRLAQLLQQVEVRSENEKTLNRTVEDLHQRLENSENENKQNIRKVQDLETQLQYSSQLVEKQAERERNLNNTVQDLERQLQHSSQLVEKQADRERNLNNTVEDLHQRLETSENENKQNIRKAEDVDTKLNESLVKIVELEDKVKLLNEKVAEMGRPKRCPLENEHEIRKAVQEYDSSKVWEPLRNSLSVSLDHSSLAYRQLLDVADNSFPAYVIGSKGYKDLAEVLVYCGGGVDMADSDKYTMLHAASIYNQPALVKFLLDNGADIEPRNIQGYYTPLMHAALNGHLHIAQLLVQAGASTTARDSDNRTALDIARVYGKGNVEQYLSQFPH